MHLHAAFLPPPALLQELTELVRAQEPPPAPEVPEKRGLFGRRQEEVPAAALAAGPLLAAAALMFVSWQATLLVIGLTPVMIVFFALVGGEIRRRADIQERSFGRLAGQFADRIRTLPTILANHALAQEKEKLAGRLETYAHNTMGVLRIAFVNAGIIDFFASLSIAMLAVLLGLGHLKLVTIPGFSDLELWQSLFVLMIAPDYFAPFRRFSEQYNAKAEGLAAAAAQVQAYSDAALVGMHTQHACRRDRQLPARTRLHDACHHLRRGAVAMHVPPGPEMPQEAPPIFRRQLLPQPLRMRPQPVDHAAPAAP